MNIKIYIQTVMLLISFHLIYAKWELIPNQSPNNLYFPIEVYNDTLLAFATNNYTLFRYMNNGEYLDYQNHINIDSWPNHLLLFKNHYFIGTSSSTVQSFYVSHDFGETWVVPEIRHDNEDKFDKLIEVRDMSIYNEVLYISGEGGFYVSKDFGTSWKSLNGYGDTIINLRTPSQHIIIDSMILIKAGIKTKNGKIFVQQSPWLKSFDNGRTWKSLYMNKTYGNIDDRLAKIGNLYFWITKNSESQHIFTIDPFSEEIKAIRKFNNTHSPYDTLFEKILSCGNVLYAFNYFLGIFVSTDYGLTWIAKNEGLDELPEGQGYGIADLAANDNFIFVSAGNILFGSAVYRAPLKDCEIVNATDVKEPDVNRNDISFEIFPNPASDKIYISVAQTLPSVNPVIEIYNVLGELVLPAFSPSIKRGSGGVSLDVSSLPAGIYYISLKAACETVIKQFAVIR